MFELLQLDPASTTFHSDTSSLRDDASAASTGWTLSSHPANVKVGDAAKELRRATIRYCADLSAITLACSSSSSRAPGHPRFPSNTNYPNHLRAPQQ
ncbi:hypothetical protein CF326_g6334 [Tilletia indica]|nr:hypothetical protein CF326_g6334 [Tilletia indica]